MHGKTKDQLIEESRGKEERCQKALDLGQRKTKEIAINTQKHIENLKSRIESLEQLPSTFVSG